MENLKIKPPIWFWILAVIFLVWNLMGFSSFFIHTFISEEALAQLPKNEQELYNNFPIWVTIVFAIAVLFGLIGSIGLILRKKWCKTAFMISLCAIIPQMTYNVFFTKSIEVYGLAQTITMPILVIVFGVFLVWFSGFCIQKKWIL